MMFEKEPGKTPRANHQAVPCPLPLVIEAEGIEEVLHLGGKDSGSFQTLMTFVAMATPPFWC